MAAYLIVDVDDLMQRFAQRGISMDLQELAVGLRGGAALAAGLISADSLKAVAVANWGLQGTTGQNYQRIFKTAGYEVFDMPRRDKLADALIVHYFSYDPEPVDELILATTSTDLIPLVRRVKMTRHARIRIWGSENIVAGTEFAEHVIFQPLETLLGIQTKNVAVYVDFENIAISLNEQGFIVNLDHLIERFVSQAQAYGHVVKMAAYAPWGQRGSLPPLVDNMGREVADDAMTRLFRANIDPVFNPPGKNSADMRIARDVMGDAGHSDAADVIIMASGDRDFNQVLTSLRARNKSVVVWGVRGSTSRVLENNPGVQIEYIEDFTDLQTHQALSTAVYGDAEDTSAFTPSQWSSVIIQFDRLAQANDTQVLSVHQLVGQLQEVNAVVSRPRGEDLVSQAISLGILKAVSGNGLVMINAHHPIVEKTRLIRERVVTRVMNTLSVRGWEYVNYGFLLKGLAMDRDLERPGLNLSDQWRSEWIDCLVREQVLVRELLPHRHNPDDLVPVIKLHADLEATPAAMLAQGEPELETTGEVWDELSFQELEWQFPEVASMARRIIISVEQFTSFRGFTWCPLGSLHRRLRLFDGGMVFQRTVEYLKANHGVEVSEYPNPQSEFLTKGISLMMDSEICQRVLADRDRFVRLLLQLYESGIPIAEMSIRTVDPETEWDLPFWFSLMETENVINIVPGRMGQYSLFRTHHTVNLVADNIKPTPSPDPSPDGVI